MAFFLMMCLICLKTNKHKAFRGFQPTFCPLTLIFTKSNSFETNNQWFILKKSSNQTRYKAVAKVINGGGLKI
jgi:hypothetical protein